MNLWNNQLKQKRIRHIRLVEFLDQTIREPYQDYMYEEYFKPLTVIVNFFMYQLSQLGINGPYVFALNTPIIDFTYETPLFKSDLFVKPVAIVQPRPRKKPQAPEPPENDFIVIDD